jgi:hypothetical protein
MKGIEPELRTYRVGDEIPVGKGYTGKIIKRTGDWLLVAKTMKRCKHVGYEALYVRKYAKDRHFPQGVIMPAGSEYLPSSEDFGTYGFAFQSDNEDYARKRFNELSS